MASQNATSSSMGPEAVTIFQETQPYFLYLIFDVLFYGVYTLVFGIYVYLQIQQRNRLHYYQIALLLLYLLGTGAVVVGILDYREWSEWLLSTVLSKDMTAPSAVAHYKSLVDLDFAGGAIYATANAIGDSILLYRFYVLWRPKRYVTAVFATICFVNTVIMFTSVALEIANRARIYQEDLTENYTSSVKALVTLTIPYILINLLVNLVLTGLIAGRICWIFHASKQVLGPHIPQDRKINGVSAIVLESGLLYPLALVVDIALSTSGQKMETTPVLTLIVGIAPTLMMVRTDLGITTDNIPERKLEIGLEAAPTSSDPEMTPFTVRSHHEPTFEAVPFGEVQLTPFTSLFDPTHSRQSSWKSEF
ncbi:hypothetical protein GYMLUDRAFT_952793 [Collybiopsis luxurians FD-317 M1]|nr:hypothetical protein GYMLUDRAFT_952793 [Collybiopsis luxurians FD-317 M1]